ncbi:MAG: hypothetical protein QW510_01550 [Candidatus Bathyarchaeia archaeon]
MSNENTYDFPVKLSICRLLPVGGEVIWCLKRKRNGKKKTGKRKSGKRKNGKDLNDLTFPSFSLDPKCDI